MLLSERIEKDGITVETVELGMNGAGTHRAWTVRLLRGEKVFQLSREFEDNSEPTAFEVLDLLTSHCSVVDQVTSAEEWGAEFDSDQEQAAEHFTPELFAEWQEINKELRSFLGTQGHKDYLYDTDRTS
jgi:hypothetical protein